MLKRVPWGNIVDRSDAMRRARSAGRRVRGWALRLLGFESDSDVAAGFGEDLHGVEYGWVIQGFAALLFALRIAPGGLDGGYGPGLSFAAGVKADFDFGGCAEVSLGGFFDCPAGLRGGRLAAVEGPVLKREHDCFF